MIIYNIQLAGLMDMNLLLKLADLKNVSGLKYTARSHDEMAFSGMCAGADGIIGSFYNLFPDLYRKILQKFAESDIRSGMHLQKIADEVIFAALKYDFPSVLHCMMNWRGIDAGYSRRPFHTYKDSEVSAVKEEILAIKKKYNTAELDMFNLGS